MTHTPNAPTPPRDEYRDARRRMRVDGWSVERQRLFLQLLADFGSVTKAAGMVNMSPSSAYALRRDPRAAAFRAGWELAMREAMRQCAEVALDRALHGVSTTVWYRGEPCGEVHKFNDRLLIQVLRYADRMNGEHAGDDVDAARRDASVRRDGNLDAFLTHLVEIEPAGAAPFEDVETARVEVLVEARQDNLDRIGEEYLAAAAAHEARRVADRVSGRLPRLGERRHEPEPTEAERAADWLASTPTPEQCAVATAEWEAAQVKLASGPNAADRAQDKAMRDLWRIAPADIRAQYPDWGGRKRAVAKPRPPSAKAKRVAALAGAH